MLCVGLASLIVVATMIAFWPVLSNGFVNWGDEADLLNNPHYRGFAPANIVWMFTTIQTGHYQPLSWLTFAFDHLIWGMDPRGYHLTSLLLHIACAITVFIIIREVLAKLMRHSGASEPRALLLAAFVGTLLFAIHPLRVETVAWATERRGSLSSLFLLWSVIWYWRYARSRPAPGNASLETVMAGWNRPYWLAVIFLGLSLLSKEFAITLPAVLIVLDIFPLRRITPQSKRMPDQVAAVARSLPSLLKEKIPLIALAVVGAAVAILSSAQSGVVKSVTDFTIPQRIAQAFFGLRFYLEKTLWPAGLSPLYPIPPHLDPMSQPFVLSAILVMALTGLLLLVRNRWPALLATWLIAVIFVSPVLGLVQTGNQIAADRYTYLPAIGLSTLIAGVLLRLLIATGSSARIAKCLGLTIACSVPALLGYLTWNQVQVWRTSTTLWQHAVSVDPNNAIAHNNLGVALGEAGQPDLAISQFERAVEIDPSYLEPRRNHGIILAQGGRLDDAIAQWEAILSRMPENSEAIRLIEQAREMARKRPQK